MDLDQIGPIVGDPDTGGGETARLTHRHHATLFGSWHRDQHPTRGFGEQQDKCIGDGSAISRKHYAATGFAREGSFDDGLDKSAFAEVVGGRDQPVARGRGEHVGEQLLTSQIDGWWNPAQMVTGDLGPDRPIELVAGVTKQI